MGGRGSRSSRSSNAGGASGSGGGIAQLSKMIQNEPQNALSQLGQILKSGTISNADFTENGSSVRSQSVVVESGSDKIEVYFYSRYEPKQVTSPSQPIKTGIYANVWRNGQPVAIRTIAESKTKSLKNAKTQYENILSEWKKATGQKRITF